MSSNILGFRIWMLSFIISLSAVTAICAVWLRSEQNHAVQSCIQRVLSNRDSGLSKLTAAFEKQADTAFTLSFSPTLRQRVVSYSQELHNVTIKTREKDLESEVQRWIHSDRESDEFHRIFSSLEANYLRDVTASSNSIADEVIVTDAFGLVRITSSPPIQLFCFNEEWWQRALKLRSRQIYRFVSADPEGNEWLYFCLPLFDDEGRHPVGVIRMRLPVARLLEKAYQIDGRRIQGLYFITDWGHVFPDDKSGRPISISEVKSLSRNSSDGAYIDDRSIVVASTSLSGKIPLILPDFDWLVTAYSEVPRIYMYSHPTLQKVLKYWFFALLLTFLLTYQLMQKISQPFNTFLSGIRQLSKGLLIPVTDAADHSMIPELAETQRELVRTFEEKASLATRSLKQSSSSLKAFSDLTQEAALEYDRRIIAESLLRISIRLFDADAGLLLIHNPDYKTPMRLQFNLTDDQIDSYKSLALHNTQSKQIYFSWDHSQHETIWKDGFQVIISVPVRTRQIKFGTLYLLFQKAIDAEIEKDQTLDLLAQQCAVYTSRSALFHQLDRQINFTESILAGIPWFICTIDSQMKITWHNQRTERLFIQLDTLIGTRCYESFKGRDNVCVDCLVRQTINDGLSHESTQQWISPTGENLWVRLNSFPLKDETGQMRSAVLFIRNISAEIETSSEVRRFARAIDSIGEVVIITDMDGRIVFTNKAFSHMLLYSSRDVKGHHIEVLFPGEEAGIHKKIVSALHRDRQWIREMDLLKRDERRIPFSITASLVLDEEGNAIGNVIICFDLSVRLQREKQVIRHYKELEILHKINQLLIQNLNLAYLLKQILNQVSTFTGCQAGTVILFEEAESEDPSSDAILFDVSKPHIKTESGLPGYFSKLIEELRHGRESSLLRQSFQSTEPTINNNLHIETSVESRLIAKMGFQAMLAIPVRSQSAHIGVILLFSSHSFHFSSDNMDIYKSIATQVGMSLHARFLQDRLLRNARFALTGEIVSRIGADIHKIVQELHGSRFSFRDAMRNGRKEEIGIGWEALNRQIWQIYQLSQNISALNTENTRFYFPENINELVNLWISQFSGQSFIEKISIRFCDHPLVSEVFINKLSIQRAFTNLMTLTVDACWDLEGALISVRVLESFGGSDYYAIEIEYPQHADARLQAMVKLGIQTDSAVRSGAAEYPPLLLTEAIRCIKEHKGQLMTITGESGHVFRIVLPRYPVRSV